MTKTRETIARVEFRWREHEEHFAQQLNESAREAGHSTSNHARKLVKDALTNDEQLRHDLHLIQQEIAQLHLQLRELHKIAAGLRATHEGIYELRDDLANYAIKLLSDAGRLEPETAARWVKETIRAE